MDLTEYSKHPISLGTKNYEIGTIIIRFFDKFWQNGDCDYSELF